MRKFLFVLACAAALALPAGAASADDLRGRLALTARIGVTNPADGEKADRDGTLLVKTDPGIIGGGGLLIGVDDNLALDLEATRSSYHAQGFGTAGVTDVSFGAQYRLPEIRRFVYYGGAGLNVLINSVSNHMTDTVVGFHLAAGADYKLMRELVLNAELKGVEAFDGDVRGFNGVKLGEFDPSHVALTVGARFFFN